MKAIETIYNGYKFRSRLEARWAVFFDAAGIKYEYEPEGFDLGDGCLYLPDFYLHDIGGRAGENGLWVEVKGIMSHSDWHKIEKFSDQNKILVVSGIPENHRDWNCHWDDERIFNFETIDGDCYMAQFYQNKDGGIELWGWDNVTDCSGFEALNHAYAKARQARFEHGEKPKQKTIAVKAETKVNENWLADLADRFGDDECKKKYGSNKDKK